MYVPSNQHEQFSSDIYLHVSNLDVHEKGGDRTSLQCSRTVYLEVDKEKFEGLRGREDLLHHMIHRLCGTRYQSNDTSVFIDKLAVRCLILT